MPPGNGSIVLGLQIAKCYRTDRRDVSRWVRAWCPVVAGAVFVNLTFEMEPSVSQSTRLSERALFNISTQHDVAGSKRDAGDVGIKTRSRRPIAGPFATVGSCRAPARTTIANIDHATTDVLGETAGRLAGAYSSTCTRKGVSFRFKDSARLPARYWTANFHCCSHQQQSRNSNMMCLPTHSNPSMSIQRSAKYLASNRGDSEPKG